MAEQLEIFQAHRGRMFGIAYRMLGSAMEAEEILQDAWLRWQSVDHESVKEPAAFLAKTVTNLCLNQLTSARARRETYVGEWLPEPVLTGTVLNGAGLDDLGPLDEVAQRESVSFALLTVMEKLTPAERAAYVLREAFAYSHREVADLIGTTEANARQLHSRARKRVAADQEPREVDAGQWRVFVERFLAAAKLGDIAGLESLLAADVVSRADSGGKTRAARQAVIGRSNVARYLTGVLEKFGAGFSMNFAQANGEPVLLVTDAEAVRAVVFVTIENGELANLDFVMNPDKLGLVENQLSRIGGVPGLG